MGISEILTKKTGGTPDVTMAKVSETLKASLDQLLQTKQMESVAEVVKTIVSKDNSNNPLSGLKEIGLDVKSIIENNQQIAHTALTELHKAREQVLEEKAKNLEYAKGERMEELATTKSLLEIVVGLQNKTYDQQMSLLKELYQERIKNLEEAKKPQEEDQIKKFLETLMIGLLQERLQRPQTVDPKSQIKEYVETVKELSGLLGGGNSSAANEMEKRLIYDLELKKLELENAKWARELEEKKKIEERKLETWNSFINQFKEILPVAVSLIQQRGGTTPNMVSGNVISNPVASPPRSYRIICSNCGEDTITSDPSQITECPHCKSPMFVRQESLPALEKSTSTNGGIEI